MNRRLGFLGLGAATLASASLTAAVALGAGESYDASFDGNGAQTTSFPNGGFGEDIAVEPDGQIVTVGRADFGFGQNLFGVVRYNSNGSLDTAGFGSGTGKVTTNIGANTDVGARGVAIQDDGKIVVAGSAYLAEYSYGVARYGADGTLDTGTDADPGISFSTDGMVATDVAEPGPSASSSSSEDVANDVAIAPDNGDIVAVGGAGIDHGADGELNDIGIAVYDSNGAPDNSFSGNGILTQDLPGTGTYERGNAVEVQPDGKIVVAGFGGPDLGQDGLLLRYKTDGGLDPTFSDDGILKVDFGFGAGEEFLDLDLQSDGKIVAAGSSGGKFAVARVNSNGTLDASFDGDGKETVAPGAAGGEGTDDAASGVEVLPSGKIVLGGKTGSGFSWGAVRLTSNGVLDSALVSLPFPGSSVGSAHAMAVQGDGKVLLTGTATSEDPGASMAFGTLRFASLGVPPPPQDVTRPLVSATGVNPKTFAVDAQGKAETPVAAGGRTSKAAKGTTFTYTLSEKARDVFTIQQKTTGRKVRGKCRKKTRKNRKRRKCTLYKRAGRFAQQGVKGKNTKKFSGKIGRKKLKPGSYRATLVATDAAGNASKPTTLTFKIVRR